MKRPPAITGLMMLMMGLIGLSNAARNPRFGLFRTVDVLQLIGTGMCFGVALAFLFVRLAHRREG
jgi:hypothetical protein